MLWKYLHLHCQHSFIISRIGWEEDLQCPPWTRSYTVGSASATRMGKRRERRTPPQLAEPRAGLLHIAQRALDSANIVICRDGKYSVREGMVRLGWDVHHSTLRRSRRGSPSGRGPPHCIAATTRSEPIVLPTHYICTSASALDIGSEYVQVHSHPTHQVLMYFDRCGHKLSTWDTRKRKPDAPALLFGSEIAPYTSPLPLAVVHVDAAVHDEPWTWINCDIAHRVDTRLHLQV
jgi:hypothetical protein